MKSGRGSEKSFEQKQSFGRLSTGDWVEVMGKKAFVWSSGKDHEVLADEWEVRGGGRRVGAVGVMRILERVGFRNNKGLKRPCGQVGHRPPKLSYHKFIQNTQQPWSGIKIQRSPPIATSFVIDFRL